MSGRLSGRSGSTRASSQSRSQEPNGFHRTPMVVAVRCRDLNMREKSLGETRFPNRDDTGYCSIVNVNKETGVVGMIDPDNVGRFSANLTSATNSGVERGGGDSGGCFDYNADREYNFDMVFDPTSTNEEVYKATVAPLVQCVKEGYNGTCFAYGMTGAGKTYTMSGNTNEQQRGGGKHSSAPVKGLCSLAVDDLFPSQKRQEGEVDPLTGGKIVTTVHASYLELYNERIRDLLVSKRRASTSQAAFSTTKTSNSRTGTPTTPGAGLESEPTFDIVEDPEHGIHVPQLSEVQVTSTEHLERLIGQGGMRRTKATTNSNAVSSRSHAILQLTVKRRFIAPATAGAGGVPPKDRVLTGKLSLIDLAGSERATTEIISADGGDERDLRRREGANINRSLLALGNCITVLGNISQTEGVDVNHKSATSKHHVPYRDSKLTRLLKESLGGNTRTVMIASITPSCLCYEETLSTLKYATRAKAITRKVQKNAVVTVVEEETESLVESNNGDHDLKGQAVVPRLISPAEESRDREEGHQAGTNSELKTMIFSLQHEVSSLKAQLFVTQHTNEKLGLSRSNSALSTCSTTSFQSRGSRMHPSELSHEEVELSCLSDAPPQLDTYCRAQRSRTDPYAPQAHPRQRAEEKVTTTGLRSHSATLEFMSGIRRQLDDMILAEAVDASPAPKQKADVVSEGGFEDPQSSSGGGVSLRTIHINAPPTLAGFKSSTTCGPVGKPKEQPKMTSVGKEMLRTIAQRTGAPELLQLSNINQ